MHNKYEILARAGIDMEELMENMGYDEKIVNHVLIAFLSDKNYEDFCDSMKRQDYGKVFLTAHTLKGVLSNLAMKNLQIVCSNIVEKLRNKDYDNIDCDMRKFCNMYNEIRDTIMEVYNE